MNEIQPDAFKSYARRYAAIFLAVVCGTLLMVGASYARLSNPHINIALVLAAACFNAFFVAGYLMHLITERKMIMAVLVFTAFFFVGLMGLTIWASYDIPGAMKH